MDNKNKTNEKGVIIVTSKIQKWGNSLAIRIPKNVADQLNIDQGSEIELHVQDETLTIKPKMKKVTLEELLLKVTDENRHQEIDFGTEGNESL